MRQRYKAISPVTDFSVSQRIRVQLIEDGHTELAVESITQPIRDLEEEIGFLRKRVKAIELDKVNWVTESGVFRVLEKRAGKVAVNWGKVALNGLVTAIGAGILALVGWLLRLAWKGLHV